MKLSVLFLSPLYSTNGMLHEISRRIIHLTKYEDIDLVWHNNVLTVRCDSGLHLFDYTYNLKCQDKNIDFYESKILTSKCSPATELFPTSVIERGMKNIELSEMVLDPSLWPHNKQLMEVAITTAFEWSPVDFIHNHESVLAAVNSAGNIDLYSHERHSWNKLENLSLKLKHEMESKIPNLNPPVSYNGKINFKIVKEAAYALEASCICWCPVLNEDKSCYFVTAQKNGLVLFWILKYGDNCVDAELIQFTDQNKDEIVAMKWIPTLVNKFILVVSNVHGQVLAYQCQIGESSLEIVSIHSLWAYKDKMIAQYIEYEILNNNIVIACNKHRHLLSLIIDNTCEVLYQNVKNVNDQKITCVVKRNGRFYTSTVNRELYEIKFVIDNESLDTHLVPIGIKGLSSIFELYSFDFSTNDVFVACALLNRTILCRKLPFKLEIIVYTKENQDLEINRIINNPTRTLTDLWDIIESLRCKTLKTKELPKLDYNKLYLDAKRDIFFGRVYLILLILHNNLEITVQNNSRGLLPETSVDVIKSNILACHAVELVTKLCDNMTEDAADKFVLQCLHMAGIYLKEYCSKNKTQLNELLPPNIIKQIQDLKVSKYTCQWCDNTLKGFTCKDQHMNPFCSLTFTLIETNEYLVCRSCGATARSEIILDKPKCVFCDIYLCSCDLPS